LIEIALEIAVSRISNALPPCAAVNDPPHKAARQKNAADA
jgi:hypothetical protein